MPNATTLTIPATEVKRGDHINGNPVLHVTTLKVNIEFTMDGAKPIRVRRDNDSMVTVTRYEATYDEKRTKLSEQLNEYTTNIMEYASRTAGREAELRMVFTEATDLLYAMEWKVEDTLKELQKLRLLRTLDRWLTERQSTTPPHVIILEFIESTKAKMLQWSPGRSTSQVHNLSSDCEFQAMRSLIDGSDFSAMQWALDAIAKLDDESGVNAS